MRRALLQLAAAAIATSALSCASWRPFELEGVIAGIYPRPPAPAALGADELPTLAPAASPGWIIVVRTSRGAQQLYAGVGAVANFDEGDLVTICGYSSGSRVRWRLLKHRDADERPAPEASTPIVRFLSPPPPVPAGASPPAAAPSAPAGARLYRPTVRVVPPSQQARGLVPARPQAPASSLR